VVPKTHLFQVEANSSASDSLDSYDQWHFINVSLNYLSILESPGIIIPNIPLGDTVQSGVITEQKTKKEQKAVVVAVNSLLLLHQGQLASDERQSKCKSINNQLSLPLCANCHGMIISYSQGITGKLSHSPQPNSLCHIPQAKPVMSQALNSMFWK